LQLIGRIDTALAFVNALAAARPDSAVARQARADLHTLWVRDLLHRGEPRLALSAGHASTGGKPLANLLGIAAALPGAPVTAIEHFHAALPVVGDDARVEQNLALTALLAGDAARARVYWQRYLVSMAAHCPAPPGEPDYLLRLGELIRRRLTSEDGP
jgi:Flp pilus assembly protein TadD